MTNLNNQQRERLLDIVEFMLLCLSKPKGINELIQGEYEIQRAIALLKQAEEKLKNEQLINEMPKRVLRILDKG